MENDHPLLHSSPSTSTRIIRASSAMHICMFLETNGTLKSTSDLKRVCHNSLQCGQCFMLSFITKILSVVTGMPNTEEAEQSLSRLREERRRVLSLDSDTKYLDRDNAKDTKDPGVDYFIKSTISLTFLNFACFAYLAHFACFAYFAHIAYFPNCAYFPTYASTFYFVS